MHGESVKQTKHYYFFSGNKYRHQLANIWQRRASDARFAFSAENKQIHSVSKLDVAASANKESTELWEKEQ